MITERPSRRPTKDASPRLRSTPALTVVRGHLKTRLENAAVGPHFPSPRRSSRHPPFPSQRKPRTVALPLAHRPPIKHQPNAELRPPPGSSPQLPIFARVHRRASSPTASLSAQARGWCAVRGSRFNARIPRPPVPQISLTGASPSPPCDSPGGRWRQPPPSAGAPTATSPSDKPRSRAVGPPRPPRVLRRWRRES